ncbi:hypothetical protein MRB56_21800 [Halomonas cupida]|uniref:hypothetical protein n=1 Tax=Halomonas cupida TaxID=44933 RepID=UPI0039B52A46
MIRKNPNGDLPQIHPSSFVDPTAILCGRVIVEENAFIGPYAVIRADEVDAEGQVELDVLQVLSIPEYCGNDTRSSTVVSEPLGRWALEALCLS